MEYFVDIQVWDTNDPFAQARYLVHSLDDVLWTDDLDAALEFLKWSIEKEGNE